MDGRARWLGGLMLAGALVASASVSPAQAQTAAKAELSMWYFNFARHVNYQKDRINAYTQKNPNVTIKYDSSAPPVGEGGYEVKVNTALATNTAPDIFAVFGPQAARMITNKQLAPIDAAAAKTLGFASVDALKASRLPGSFEFWSDPTGTPYGLQWEISWLNLYCNDEHLKAGGVDPATVKLETWDDVMTVGKKVIAANPTFYKDSGGKFTRNFLKFPMYLDDGWSMQLLTAFLAQSGGSVLSPDKTAAAINSPAAVKAVQTMVSLSRELGDPNLGPRIPGEIFGAFASGQQTCVTTSQTLYRSFLIPNNSPILGKYHAWPLPSIEKEKPGNVFWGWAFVVNTQSKNKEAAWDFIRFLLDDPQASSVAVSVWQPIKGVQDGWAIKQVPFSDAIWASARGGQAIFIHDKYPELARLLRGTIEVLAFQGGDVKKALDEAAVEVNKRLK